MTSTQSKITKATIYVRLSVYGGTDDPTLSPERQEKTCRDYCAAKGWTVTRVVKDLDVSGSDKGMRLDRPGLVEIRSDWANTDIVIFSKLDRLARNVIDFRTFSDEAAANGAALVSVNESLDLSTPTGKFVATILAAFSELEAATIAERVKGGIDSVRKAHRFSGGNVPYGYQIADNPDGNGKILVVNRAEQEIIVEAAQRIVKGHSLSAICRDFNERGIKSRRGGNWVIHSLKVALTGDAIIGRVMHRGELMRDEITGLPIQMWEPVLDLALWSSVKAILAPKGEPIMKRRRTRLLSGLIVCDSCGKKMYARKAGGRADCVYFCPSRSEGIPCPGVSIACANVEDYVIDGYILGIAGDEPHRERKEIATGRIELDEIERAIRETTSAMASDDANIPELISRLSTLKTRRAELESMPEQVSVEWVETGQTISEWWAGAELAEQQKMLSVSVKEVRISKATSRKFDPSRISVVWQSDFLTVMPTDDLFTE